MTFKIQRKLSVMRPDQMMVRVHFYAIENLVFEFSGVNKELFFIFMCFEIYLNKFFDRCRMNIIRKQGSLLRQAERK